MTDRDPTAAQANGKRKKLLIGILAIFACAGVAYGAYWLTVARHLQSTDDAYVEGNVVQITPQIEGTVVGIEADDTQFVHAGDPLVELDGVDASVALEAAKAELAQAVREVRGLFAHADELRSGVTVREVELAKARADLQRREGLEATGAVSAEEVQHARDAVHGADSALAALREQLAGQTALVDDTSVASHPRVARAAAKLRAAYIDYRRTVIPAPVSGFVARRSVQLGQRVSPGTPLMAVVPPDEVWVSANFKEVRLARIRVGQPARVVADANGVDYHGTVVGFGAGTGAAFALLPPQNATGNWIKVVQRLPVRIALDPGELEAHPLAIGLSTEVSIDLRAEVRSVEDTAPAEPRPSAPTAYRTTVYVDAERTVDALIATLIATTGGGAAVARAPPGAADSAEQVAVAVAGKPRER
jgi:membrane fusion protein (multidrug efflux system)